MSGGLDPRYDFALLGTSLPLSILSAALSRAGFSVLHVDEEEHYGGPWSSLTLSELLEWSRNTALFESQGKRDVSLAFPAFNQHEEIPQSLSTLDRHFSISLSPTIVPCAGPTIEVLIRSKVASYCTFRLLQKTSIYISNKTSTTEWPLQKVPSSKEDIFKDKTLSLVDKRRLMKLLQQAVPSQDVSEGEGVASSVPSKEKFFDYLLSKEGANLSPQLSSSIAYGVALCSSEKDSTAAAMERIRRHITGIGRYGNAAYLVGQYGGAGEMAQCFCRASAVQGGTFVLGHQIESCFREDKEASESDGQVCNWTISLAEIEGTTRVEHLVGDSDLLHRVVHGETQSQSTTSASSPTSISGILLLDRGILFEDPHHQSAEGLQLFPPETGLVIFPPQKSSSIGAVSALQMAEGTFSCPKGMYLIYLSVSVLEGSSDKIDARKEFKTVRDEILRLVSKSAPEWHLDGLEVEKEGQLLPLMECYYTAIDQNDRNSKPGPNLWSAQSLTTNLATSLDDATLQAETLFWNIVGIDKRGQAEQARRKRRAAGYSVGQGLGGVVEGAENEAICDFFPCEEAGGDDDE